jgi:hypothetical protein
MRKHRSTLPVIIALAVAGVGLWGWAYYRHHTERLGVGTPLDQTHSKIDVLGPAEEPVALPTDTSSTAIIGEPGASPTEAHKDLSDGPIIMTSSTVILSPAAAPATNDQQIQHLQLGVLLTLMAQQYATGGDAALTTLKSAQQLAPAGLKTPLTTLRDHTPNNGPITPALLLVEAQRIRALGAPENADEDAEAKEPAGWLSRLVQVKNIQPRQPARPWGNAFSAMMLQLAANNPASAAAELNAAPLKTDARLDDLRTALADYIAQNNALNDVLAAYLNETSHE